MKGSSFIKAWNLMAVCPFTHQRGPTQPTSGASNKHSLFHLALPFTGSTEPSPILKATQILQLNWKNDEDVTEGLWPAIPFGVEGYSQPRSICWANVYCINANWCSKGEPCSSFLCWSGNTVTYWTFESTKSRNGIPNCHFMLFLLLFQDNCEALTLLYAISVIFRLLPCVWDAWDLMVKGFLCVFQL